MALTLAIAGSVPRIQWLISPHRWLYPFAIFIFSAFADFERDLIVERTQEGKELAKQKPDFREGRPKKFNQQQINLAMNLLKNHSYKEVEKMTGISKSTLTRNNRKMQNKPQIGV